MEIVRYVQRHDGVVRVGVRENARVTPVAVSDLAHLWSDPASDLPATLGRTSGPSRSEDEVVVLPPVDGQTEVWAAGVTYERSRVAREEESSGAGVYELVYQAARPELFFKSVAWRVVTDDEPVGLREDSELNVPEAELALVINAHAEIVGYTICNDMSSRSIEGENPLYLPQAKIYEGSCAVASGIRPWWEVSDAADLGIELIVSRHGEVAWHGATNTSALYRTFADLVRWLFAEQSFPSGVILSTGTGLVPAMEFSLQPDDEIRIVIEEVGTLVNYVGDGRGSFSWLAAAVADPLVRETVRRTSGRERP
jgi:2-dehydro-3-deoxy-D-arabinonate dehydratase